jgi:hypothetical protein
MLRKATKRSGRRNKRPVETPSAPGPRDWRKCFCYDQERTWYLTKTGGVWVNIQDIPFEGLKRIKSLIEDDFMIETRGYRAIVAEIERRQRVRTAA